MKGDYCGPGDWVFAAFGVLLVVFGYMLWVGNWSLDRTLAAVIILVGAKKLFYSCRCYMGKK